MIYFWLINLNLFKTHTTETGLSDYHKLISTFFKSKAPRLKPKIIFIETFDEKSFLDGLQNKNFSIPSNDPNVNYKSITDHILEIKKHAPLKKKFVRGNQAFFMNRDFRKAIYIRTRLKNKYWRDTSRENELACNKQKYLYVSISITNYLNKFSDKVNLYRITYLSSLLYLKLIFLEINQTISHHFIYLFIYFLFNWLFTVDFSIVITTNLHRLTENFMIKRKI